MFHAPLKQPTKNCLKELKIPKWKKKQEKGQEKHFCIKGKSYGCCYYCYFAFVKVVFYGNL